MPADDWALGQNEVDVRNEARNPLNAVSPRRTYDNECAFCGVLYDGRNAMSACPAGRHMWRLTKRKTG